MNSGCEYYQFGGWTGALKLSYELVDARHEQVAQRILLHAGYSCNTNDIMKLTGHDPEDD